MPRNDARRRTLHPTRVLAGALALTLLQFVPTRAATVHGGSADVHSPNMSLVATLETGHGGELAFWKDFAVLAHGVADGDHANDGFDLIDIGEPTRPRLVSSFRCAESAWDVAVWRDLVFLAANADMAGPSCDAEPLPSVGTTPDDLKWGGLRIVSIADPSRPRLVTSLRTNSSPSDGAAGPHTFTILPDLAHRDPAGRRDPRLLLYMSGGGPYLKLEEIVEVPLDRPDEARIVATFPTTCHDFTVFQARRLGVCAGAIGPRTDIWDLRDPVRPVRVSEILNPEITHHHGSVFSSDGNTLVLTDESALFLGNYAGASRCDAGGDSKVAGMWFYDVADAKRPVLKGFYQLPQSPDSGRWCGVHQANVVPLRGDRDVLVAAWYAGGTTVVDFSDPANPRQIAHYIAEPASTDRFSNPWASYWYNGFVYANNVHSGSFGMPTERGLDVFSVHDPALAGAKRMKAFNFGTQ